MGRAHAGNVGIENAKGDYIGFLDDDDEFYPEHVSTLVNFLETEQNYGVVYTDSLYISQEWTKDRYMTVGKEVLYSQDFDRQRLLLANYIPMLNVMLRKDLLDKAGLFDEKLEAHEDWDMWLRLSKYSDFCHIKKVTAEVSMRTDGTTITSNNRKAFLETARIIHKRYSSSAADENIVKSQNIVEWLLAKQVVANGEKLENSYLVNIAETLIQQKDTQIGNLGEAISEKDTQIVNLEAAIREKDTQTAYLQSRLDTILNSRGWKFLIRYYWIRDILFSPWFILLSNCRDLTLREIENFPIGLNSIEDATKQKLAKLSVLLMKDLKSHAYRKECSYKATGKVIYDEFYPKYSKPIIDEIDRVLAKHYGFTDEELDFIINYNVKYRMGRDSGGEV